MATSRRLSSARSDRVTPGRFAPSATTARLAIGVTVTVCGVLWILLGSASLSWFGLSPIGLYRSIDQPPILLTLVGVWYTARGLIGTETDEALEQEEVEGVGEGGGA